VGFQSLPSSLDLPSPPFFLAFAFTFIFTFPFLFLFFGLNPKADWVRRDNLRAYLRPFAEDGKVVGDADVQTFFEQLNKARTEAAVSFLTLSLFPLSRSLSVVFSRKTIWLTPRRSSRKCFFWPRCFAQCTIQSVSNTATHVQIIEYIFCFTNGP
jgi:hypothetical protein